jgi:hypothetical protein
MAQRAASRLGLAFEHRPAGYDELGGAMRRFSVRLAPRPAARAADTTKGTTALDAVKEAAA